MTSNENATTVKSLARDLGFDLVGIARPQPSAHPDAYRAWIAAGKHGEMQYLARNIEDRLDLRIRFPWAKSVLCVALAYYQDPQPAVTRASSPASAEGSIEHHPACQAHTPPVIKDSPLPEPTGKIARYAWGRDYHKVLEGKLKKLERRIRETFDSPTEKIHARAYADTGPLLERELAARAGLGWIGKNSLLIHPRHGSWFVLGELILSLDLAPDTPLADHCGTCRRCLDACPTHAIEPYTVDARKCLSYLTLEHRAAIDPALHAPMQAAGFLAGCDICQEVCPFNRQPLACTTPDFAPRPPAPAISLTQVLAWQEQEWDILTRGRATRRIKFDMWQRNAQIVASASRR